MKEFDCTDCQVNTLDIDEYYMVNDHVWRSVVECDSSNYGADGGVMLCIGCLETRLDRELVGSDFSDAPINWIPVRQSDRLRDRLASITIKGAE